MKHTLTHHMASYRCIRSVLAIALATCSFSSVWATFDMDVDNFRGGITVAPAVADVGTVRAITVRATWPNACPPSMESAAMEPGINPTRLILRFNVPATLVACAQVETPFGAQLNFTPSRDGDFTVVAITNDERTIAKGKMLTLLPDAPGSANFSGTWFGTDASSIAMLSHSEGPSDALVGSWNMFARDGSARWQLMHSSRRTAPNSFTAILSEFNVPANSGTCGNTACPVKGLTGRDVGTVKVIVEKNDLLNVDVLSSAASHPQLPVGSLLFRTTLSRFTF
jgi:hypothetical protein